MLNIFVVGYEHPICDKRVFRSVMSLSKIGNVYYQYLDVSHVNESCTKMVPKNVKLIPFKKTSHSVNLIHWYRKWRKFDRRLLEKILKQSIDVVYFHAMPLMMDVLFKRLKRRGMKIVFEIHEVIPDQFGKDSWRVDLIRWLIWKKFRNLLLLSDALIFVSKESADYMLKRTKVKKDYFIIPNYASFKIPPRSFEERLKRVVSVGGSPRKVPEWVVKAVIDSGYDFVFIGGMKPEKSMKSERIKFMPFMKYEKMMEEISKSMFSIISMRSSKKEWYSNDVYSLPAKLFDSLAAGTPVLVEDYFESASKLITQHKVGDVFRTLEDLRKRLTEYSEKDKYLSLLKSLEAKQDEYIWNDQKDAEYLNYLKKKFGGSLI